MMQMKKLKWTYLNKETKIFFLVLIFLFLLSILFFINRDMGVFSIIASVFFAGIFLGSLVGFIVLYKTKILEIHRGKEKYKMEERIPWKEVRIEMKIYIFFLIGLFFMAIVMRILIEDPLVSYLFIDMIFGAIIVFNYFKMMRRFKVNT